MPHPQAHLHRPTPTTLPQQHPQPLLLPEQEKNVFSRMNDSIQEKARSLVVPVVDGLVFHFLGIPRTPEAEAMVQQHVEKRLSSLEAVAENLSEMVPVVGEAEGGLRFASGAAIEWGEIQDLTKEIQRVHALQQKQVQTQSTASTYATGGSGVGEVGGVSFPFLPLWYRIDTDTDIDTDTNTEDISLDSFFHKK